jgi:hypothetical protein
MNAPAVCFSSGVNARVPVVFDREKRGTSNAGQTSRTTANLLRYTEETLVRYQETPFPVQESAFSF